MSETQTTPARRAGATGSAGAAPAAKPRTAPTQLPDPQLLQRYRDDVMPALKREFDYENVMEIPRIAKVIVNIGIGEAKDNPKALEAALGDVKTITGQAPVAIKTKKNVAAFKVREGNTVGIKVTLRGRRMWHFLEKTIGVALPRIRDFRGVSDTGFDGRGNYSLGLREQIIFPEIEYDKIDKIRGLEITVVTTAKTDEEARSLLAKLGMPFAKRGAR